jgi:hypothetical protein
MSGSLQNNDLLPEFHVLADELLMAVEVAEEGLQNVVAPDYRALQSHTEFGDGGDPPKFESLHWPRLAAISCERN